MLDVFKRLISAVRRLREIRHIKSMNDRAKKYADKAYHYYIMAHDNQCTLKKGLKFFDRYKKYNLKADTLKLAVRVELDEYKQKYYGGEAK